MNTNKNTQAVQQIYADFGNGNIPGIINAVADNVIWIDPGYPDIPFGSNGRIKKEIPDFFKSLSETVEFSKFEPREFIADGNNVIVLGYHEGKTKPRNKSFGHEWIMVWKFDGNGKVASYRAFIDTNDMAKGFRD